MRDEVRWGIVRAFNAAGWLAPLDVLSQIFPRIHPRLFHSFVWVFLWDPSEHQLLSTSQATLGMVSVCHEDLVRDTVDYTEVGTLLLFVIYKTSKREDVGSSCLKHRSLKALGEEIDVNPHSPP